MELKKFMSMNILCVKVTLACALPILPRIAVY
jgi:hypothetical protein